MDDFGSACSSLNSDLVRGCCFSRPLPSEDFEKLIENEIAIERN